MHVWFVPFLILLGLWVWLAVARHLEYNRVSAGTFYKAAAASVLLGIFDLGGNLITNQD